MAHSLRITLFGITILMLGILTTLTLTPTPAEAATCNLYSAATPVPAGYGASYNVFNTSQLLVSLSCNDTTVTVTAGDNDPYTYVYNQGYIYKNNAWTPYTLSCSGGESLISGAWCPKQAKATINNAPQDATNYILAYTCEWRTDAWKCGCKDTTCSTGLWQLQGYPPAQTTPPPTLTGIINTVGDSQLAVKDPFATGISSAFTITDGVEHFSSEGGFARIYFNENGNDNNNWIQYRYPSQQQETFIAFDYRHGGGAGGSKFLKLFDPETGTSNKNTSNATFGTWYHNGTWRGVSFGDNVVGPNDAQNTIEFTGNTGSTNPVPIVTKARGSLIPRSTEWARVHIRWRQNDDGMANGVVEIYHNGELVLAAHSFRNRGDANNFIGKLRFGDHTQGENGDPGGSFHLDIRNVAISFEGFPE